MMSDGALSVRPYVAADAQDLFEALSDERAWEHIPAAVPLTAVALDALIQSKISNGLRETFTIRLEERVVGTTSVLFDPSDTEGLEVGGTQLDPSVWGAGVNIRTKRLMLNAIFAQGAQWVQLRTDERNGRSAAAIRKLGARDLGLHQNQRVRRDGTQRTSRLFRIDRPFRPVDAASAKEPT